MSNIVVIVGRPNVGKSTLFNRLIQRKQAIVDDESGVTRDRNYAKTDWNGVKFSLVDTGGYTQNSDDTFEKEIKRHVNSAIQEASLILFLLSAEDLQEPIMIQAYDSFIAHNANGNHMLTVTTC